MSEDKSDDMDEEDGDSRLDFMGTFVLKALRLKSEKWQKMIMSDEKKVVTGFFNTPTTPFITFHVNNSGLIQPYQGYCPNARNKVIYFIRNSPQKVTRDNARSILIVGEMSHETVKELAILTEEIFTPLLCNPQNQCSWPELVIEDVKKHIYSFKNILHQVCGDMNNQVLLPMPAGVEKIDQAESEWISSCGEKMDIYLKTNIEGVVIQWATQVKNLLKENSSSVFKKIQFPFPKADIEFWSTRLKNLEGVYSQLKDPRVRKMAIYLELTNSVYLQCFKTMLSNLITGVVEARDIVLYQKPLIRHFERFENTDFAESKPLIAPMMHCIGLLWGNSQYYCTTDKITVLFQELCNMVIDKCNSSCDPSSIYFGETIEQVMKIQQAISIVEFFIKTFEINKAKVPTFFPPKRIPIMWTFDFNKVFSRLLKLLERLRMVETMLKTTVEMLKLEKVEFSGIRGKAFSNNTLLIYEKYTKLYQQMYQIQYNPLNPEDTLFIKDYTKFMRRVNDVDQRLAKIFGEAFDESANLEGLFKFLQILGDLTHRPSIIIELQPRYEKLVTLMEKELKEVTLIFEEGTKNIKRTKGRTIIDPYFPPVAGVLWWTFKLSQRISKPMGDFMQVDNPIVSSPQATEMRGKYDKFIQRLENFEKDVIGKWIESVSDICFRNLNKCLLLRSSTSLKLNFDDELTCMLREVRYLKFLEKYTVPQEALDLYYRMEKLQKDIMKLNRAIDWYNNIRIGSHESEVALIEREINKVDEMLKEGLQTLTWSDEIENYVDKVFYIINKLQERVLTAQDNLKKCLNSVRLWSCMPLYDRFKSPKDGKLKLLAIEESQQREEKRISDIDISISNINEVIEINYELFFNIKKNREGFIKDSHSDSDCVDDGSHYLRVETQSTIVSDSDDDEVSREQHWKAYVNYIDSQVCDIVVNAISMNLNMFVVNMDLERGPNIPFLQVSVQLEEPDLIFTPSLDDQENGCLQDVINNMVEFIQKQATFFKRITIIPEKEDYSFEVNQNQNLKQMVQRIRESINYTIEDISRYICIYEKYSYLWLDDKEEYLEMFLRYGKVITREVIEELDQEETEPEPIIERPTLNIYRDQIEVFENLYKECDKLPTSRLFSGWLQLDMDRSKQALLNLVCKWGNMFKQDLVNFVHDSLNNMEDFIEQSVNSLSIELSDSDYEGLLGVMACLIKVQERQIVNSNAEFNELREVIELLKVYGLEFPEESVDQNGKKKLSVYTLLEVLPEKWKNLMSLAAVVKHNVQPLQVKHAQIISKQVTLFSYQMNIYRNDFKTKKFFVIACEDVYDLINTTHFELLHFEDIAASLTKSCELFDIMPPDKKSIVATRTELRMAKQLWDYYYLVQWTIEDWKKTPWKKIDAEGMDMECKRFTKDLRGLDKDMRTWEPYIAIEGTIKNLLTSLRAVTELQNPAIRDRHWIELMKATKSAKTDEEALKLVKIQMDEDTTLAQLLSLNLHKFEDEVKNIVDKSVKEAAMEKTLKELEVTWDNMEFEYEEHERTKLRMAKVSEELVETLEDNQTQVQNMMASKFIGFFESEVSQWQKKLSNADQAINMWFEVQRKWLYLESIFVGSEDIRNQLPQDSKRFDTTDVLFKEMVVEIGSIPNVIEATNKQGLYDRLERIHAGLVLCEKALNNYLETKRLAYPRFYFVSAADLLDILSNGNSPELVCKHLIKLYDNMAKLVFPKDTKNKIVSFKAVEMISKENDEHITFKNPCDCSGKVELWLNRLTDCMVETLHDLLNRAVSVYDDKPRDQWLFDWGAQVALVATQIWWTMETNQAFAKLEEGYENALKEYQKRQIIQLNALIVWLLLGDLSAGDRQKIMTVCTIDVHSRDVVAKMIAAKVESSNSFMWQSQLRHRWDSGEEDCFGNICDAQFRYAYEYLGNTPRLVITPLTDRCYITLTQSLHLVMGGAPAGPAGTGKTETTKDLGRALGVMVYVFNCSEQMDYKSCGNIYKGLAQTGAWGCFDEFNRISVEVLSVVSVQVKSIQDAIRHKKKTFDFMGDNIILKPTVGIFITMNPGYAGRTELPENIKSLFRPCAMVVPDFELICEIMLVAEGFQEARLLARKFITLYTLCRELLSKQDHYDWGLRAIKSVLVIAGSLKRGDRLRPEDQVLMRALRDFNIPKIVTDDVPVFMGLIGDLFPALDVPRKRDFEFEKLIQAAAVDMKLQPEAGFILKIVQLVELFAVRHSVFIIGFAGTGKTCVWKCLYRTYQMAKLKPYYNDLDPKAVTNDELFGVINPATREWKDGLFSVIMRDMANMTGDSAKWIILDGDIDPMWIESLNTLMDDNKVLTLASNERISLTKSMRLLFEISNLRTATPATVSRAGILYINPQDLGWNPYVASWVDSREDPAEKSILSILFDKYIPQLLESCKKYKRITPLTDIQQIQMVTYLLEHFLNKQNLPNDSPKEWYEMYFAFSCVWGFGSSLFLDQLMDWRCEFSKWFTSEFKTVKFPSSENIFDYFIDSKTKTFVPWSEKMERFEFDPDLPLQQCLVSTAETTRLRFFMDILLSKKHPIMLVGGVGCGKSVMVTDKLSSLPDNYSVTNVPFNFYTTSEMLQKVLEKPLEKKSGRNFGPPGNKTMIYFVDDMNMPEVDKYGTVQPHTLIRQFMNYRHWYDRTKLTLRDIHNCQFVSCMNPAAGSFTIDLRLQRHFSVFAVSFPSTDASQHIYQQILSAHLASEYGRFPPSIQNISTNLVQATLTLHNRIVSIFLPTAVKFHYLFNMRDLANIFQGLLFSSGETVKCPSELVRLWMHETTRVYCDKLIDEKDIDTFQKLLMETVKKGFDELDEGIIYEKPLIYCHFADGIGDPKYMPIRTWEHLTKLLDEGMSSYNDLVATMNLVLFEDAMQHICRINRILESPRGNALLIGVGGSGKQSLSRLSSFLSGLEVFQVQLRKGYSIPDLKNDLAGIYLKSGLKNVGSVFLMSDAQVADEKFLVLINDLLASGEIPDLFTDDEVDNIVNGVRTETKAAGIQDTKENCWKFFIDRVRKQLKVVLCFSPVGTKLRVRARKFPAIVNCTCIDWFHEWPQEALRSVSKKFLSELELLPQKLIESVALFMSYVHTTVNNMSTVYYQNERRYNYTTPKSFLEQISLFSKLLREKNDELKLKIKRLENGLLKLESCAKDVQKLKATLAAQEIALQEKNKAAEELISVVGAESDKVSKEKILAAEEEKRVKVIEEDVSIKAKICADDLAKAEPALIAAQEALNTLNKNNLTELKSFGTPPDAVVNVTAAVSVLLAKNNKIPKDRSWKTCKMMMAKVDQFLFDLVNYDKENIQPDIVKAIQPYIKDPEFLPETIVSKSSAAAGLCAWVINIMKFYEIYVVVEPKRKALVAANAELAAARSTLAHLKDKIAELEQRLSVLLANFQEAVNEKLKCQGEADATNLTIDLANRLVNGLASEKIRWTMSVANLRDCGKMLPGDVLLITAFISYVGCFTHSYRSELLNNLWIPFLYRSEPKIPITENLDPLSVMTDDAQVAAWNNEGLPADRMSTDNATILTHSARWPLIIDPQLQGIKWIKNHYNSQLVVVRLTSQSYLDTIEKAIVNGSVLLIENIGETVEAVLDPLLGRQFIKKGKVIKIGDKEIDYNPMFRLIIQTKIANPHYQPEMQAQCTLINFTVTRDGLEEQLLGEVVKAERPDLESLRAELTKQQNDFKITLKSLEDDLLCRLSSAGPDILNDSALVTNLETTKKTAAKIEAKVKEAKITSLKIDEAREHYRPAAERASLLYFILTDLSKINPIYQFSLKAYNVVFKDALSKAQPGERLTQRVTNLLDSITFSVFSYTSRGLFESDKLIFLCQIALQIQLSSEEVSHDELDFLLRFNVKPAPATVHWLTDQAWGGILALSKMEEFMNLDKDIESASKRWQKFCEGEAPEKDKFPGEWKNKTALQRLCMLRALRPDRMTYATRFYIKEQLGAKFVEARTIKFSKSYEETSPSTPVFFILSPGVDPLKDVEKLGESLGFTTNNQKIHIVSLGQGQEVVAEQAMEFAATHGHWVMLQNVHLVSKWLDTLEKKIEQYSDGSHDNYRLFLSAEPAAAPEYHIIPQGILESAIKITNEPSTGMQANLHKALDNFSQDTLEMCSKEAEFKGILFALCYFHAVVVERGKFGPQGWNRNYPFNIGDLMISVYVLYNYLENNSRVPWEDLRYLFGEIMYGGHITDDWDRRLCRTYLSEYMQPELIDGELFLAPGFLAPPNSDYSTYHSYIDENLPGETPYLYGLHPNAEIGVLTTLSDQLFRTVFEMQPRDGATQGGSGMSREEKIKAVLEDILDKVPEPFNVQELMSKVEERTPFIIVAFQECERMNVLMGEIKRSLKELELGLKGELTITNEMEELQTCLLVGQVPSTWTQRAYPSMLPLASWFTDLCVRLTELESWAADFTLPSVVWLGGFFNPQSFLTAIMQQTARRNEWPLDKMCLNCDVTKKQKDEITNPPKEGAFVHGLYMEGARWDLELGSIAESRLKELFPLMPVIYIKAVTQDKQDVRNVYDCPVYKIRMRGPTYVWTFNLRTRERPAKWTLAGVCLLLGI